MHEANCFLDGLFDRQIEREDSEKQRTKDKKTASGLSLDEVEYFQGTEKTALDSMVSPKRVKWIATRGERDSSVMKQMREAREERPPARQWPPLLRQFGAISAPCHWAPMFVLYLRKWSWGDL